MGMYDTVYIEYPIPAPYNQVTDGWQTKDLENELYHYVITNDGVLLWKKYKYTDCSWSKEYTLEEVDYTDTMDFIARDPTKDKYACLDFSLDFVKGKVVENSFKELGKEFADDIIFWSKEQMLAAAKKICELPPEKREELFRDFTKPLMHQLDYSSLARSLFTVEPLDPKDKIK